jgi:hypothetical protein
MDNGFMMGNLWGLTGDFPGNFSSGQDLLDYAHQMPHNSYAPMSLTVDAGNAHWVGIFRDSSGNLWFRDPQAGINVPLTASSVHDLINQGYHLNGDLHLLPNPLPVKPLAKPAYDCADGLKTTPLKPGCRRPPLEPPPSEAAKSGAGLGRRGINPKRIGSIGVDDVPRAEKLGKKVPIVKYLFIGLILRNLFSNAYAGDLHGTCRAGCDLAPFNPYDIYDGIAASYGLGSDIWEYGWNNGGNSLDWSDTWIGHLHGYLQRLGPPEPAPLDTWQPGASGYFKNRSGNYEWKNSDGSQRCF